MDSNQKPIPNDTTPMPAMDADRINHSNLAPQGNMNPEKNMDSKYTPEGDHEQVPNIPPSATDRSNRSFFLSFLAALGSYLKLT